MLVLGRVAAWYGLSSRFTRRLPARRAVGLVTCPAVKTTAPSPPSHLSCRSSQDRQAANVGQLCTMMVMGRCVHGTNCRFSHDVAAYIASKPAELPGRCPFSCLDACPHGVTCMWASSHTDESGQAIRQHLAQQASSTAAANSNSAAPVAADTAANRTPADPGAPAPPSEAETASASGAASGSDAAWLAGLSPAQLPQATSIEKPVNSITRELQDSLRKQRYDFSTADAVLKGMGVNVQQRGGGGRGGGGDGRWGRVMGPLLHELPASSVAMSSCCYGCRVCSLGLVIRTRLAANSTS